MTSKKRDLWEFVFFVPLIHDLRCMSWGQTLKDTRDEVYGGFLKWWYPTTIGFPTKNDHFGVFWGYPYFWKPPYAEFPESNEWCTMQWADVFSWWFRCCLLMIADDLPSSFPPWNSKSEKWEQSLWNLSKPTKRIHFLIISGWISCFIQFEKAVVQDFLGILQPLGKNGRHAAFGSWENDPPLRSAHHPGSPSGANTDGWPILLGWWAYNSSNYSLKKNVQTMKYDEICDFVHGNISPS